MVVRRVQSSALMVDEWAGRLQLGLDPAFKGARQITLLAERDGRLVPVGDPTGAEIASASMLMASVNIRLPVRHSYVSPSIPRAFCLRLLDSTDRGAILVAPVLVHGVYVGAVVVESARGHAFVGSDLARLQNVVARFTLPDRPSA